MNVKRNKEIYIVASLIICRKFYSAILIPRFNFLGQRLFLCGKWNSATKTLCSKGQRIFSFRLIDYALILRCLKNNLCKCTSFAKATLQCLNLIILNINNS